jgi:PRC-barrel domain
VPDAPDGRLPTVEEATGWAGFAVDEVGGARVGRVHSVFVDAASGEPTWLIVALGGRGAGRPLLGRRTTKRVAVPVRDCAGGAGRVWTAHARDALRESPSVDPTRPLLREHELTICSKYGIGEKVGRGAEVAGRPQGSVTSQPAPPA